MAGHRRVERLNEQFRRELMDILHNEVRDPRVGALTVTSVEVTPDLYHAKIYLTSIDPETRESSLEGLGAAAPFIRRAIGQRLHIRRAPELHFTWDETLAHAQRIEHLLREVRPTDGFAADENAGGDAGPNGPADGRADAARDTAADDNAVDRRGHDSDSDEVR